MTWGRAPIRRRYEKVSEQTSLAVETCCKIQNPNLTCLASRVMPRVATSETLRQLQKNAFFKRRFRFLIAITRVMSLAHRRASAFSFFEVWFATLYFVLVFWLRPCEFSNGG